MAQYVQDRLTAWEQADTGEVVIVVHRPADEAPLAAARRILEEDGRFAQIWEAHSGCTVACHCGPNTIGVMFLRHKNDISGGS